MANQPEQILNPEQIPLNPEKTLGSAGIEQHSLETSYVGAPGSEKLVAETKNGQQVEVKIFDAGDISRNFKLIKGGEASALKLMEGQSVEQKGTLAKQTTEQSQKQAKDLLALSELFETSKNELLMVKAESARGLGIDVNFCAMLSGAKQDLVKTRLQALGYNITADERGFRAEAGNIKLYFLNGIEKHTKPKNKQEKLAA
jgi:hypothetical protein